MSAATGLGNIAGLPVELAYEIKGETEDVWKRPPLIRTDGEWMSSIDTWVDVPNDASQSTVTSHYRRSVKSPPESTFQNFLDLERTSGLGKFARRWGLLGFCTCSWNGQAHMWWRSRHEPHVLKLSWETDEASGFVLMKRESLTTWTELSRRSWLACQVAERVERGGDGSEFAVELGMNWSTDKGLQKFAVEHEDHQWKTLKSEFDNFGEPTGLAAWLADRVLRRERKVCANPECRRLFDRFGRAMYCPTCQSDGVPDRLRQRRSRDAK